MRCCCCACYWHGHSGLHGAWRDRSCYHLSQLRVPPLLHRDVELHETEHGVVHCTPRWDHERRLRHGKLRARPTTAMNAVLCCCENGRPLDPLSHLRATSTVLLASLSSGIATRFFKSAAAVSAFRNVSSLHSSANCGMSPHRRGTVLTRKMAPLCEHCHAGWRGYQRSNVCFSDFCARAVVCHAVVAAVVTGS